MHRPFPYTIRPMERGDIPAVVAIDRLSFPTPWPASSYAYELSHGAQSFYYVLLNPERDGAGPSGRGWRHWLPGVIGLPGERPLIGYAGFRLPGAEAHITTLAVHPEWRGKGLGELLLLTVMEKALELGASVVTLEMRASNPVARRLYRKYGFRLKGTQRGYYRDGEDACLLEVEVRGDAYRERMAGLRGLLEARLLGQQSGVGQNDGDTL